jgi:replicative DNA helicase
MSIFDACSPLPSNQPLELDALAGYVWCSDTDLQKRLAETVGSVFFTPEYAALWRVCQALAKDGTVDPTSLLAAVHMHSEPDAGIATVTQVLAKHVVAGPQSLQRWFGELAKLAHYRAIICDATAAVARAYDAVESPGEIEAAMEVARQQHLAEYHPDVAITVEAACQRYDAYRDWLASEHGGLLRTGLQRLDSHFGIPPEYCLILARSSVGKTALALSMAVAQVMDGAPVLYWTGEQRVEQVVIKILSIITGLSSGQVIGTEDMSRDQSEALKFARANLAKLPLHLLDGRRDVSSIWGRAAQIKSQHGLAAVYLDQLDKLYLHGRSRDNREELFARASQDVFRMVYSLQIPVFLLAQLGIKHQEKNPVPAAWQVRDCSQLIQDCDRAYVLDRPQAEPERWRKIAATRAKAEREQDMQTAHDLDLEGKGIVKLEKNRNGLGGLWEERIGFDAICGKWCNGRGRAPIEERF